MNQACVESVKNLMEVFECKDKDEYRWVHCLVYNAGLDCKDICCKKISGQHLLDLLYEGYDAVECELNFREKCEMERIHFEDDHAAGTI